MDPNPTQPPVQPPPTPVTPPPAAPPPSGPHPSDPLHKDHPHNRVALMVSIGVLLLIVIGAIIVFFVYR